VPEGRSDLGVDGSGQRVVHGIFTEHRERVAVALAEGLVVGSIGEAVLTMSTDTEHIAVCGGVASRRAAVPTEACSARDDLADLAIAFDQDPPAFLAGVLKPALEGDGVA
jgi:hypothetical protein